MPCFSTLQPQNSLSKASQLVAYTNPSSAHELFSPHLCSLKDLATWWLLFLCCSFLGLASLSFSLFSQGVTPFKYLCQSAIFPFYSFDPARTLSLILAFWLLICVISAVSFFPCLIIHHQFCFYQKTRNSRYYLIHSYSHYHFDFHSCHPSSIIIMES